MVSMTEANQNFSKVVHMVDKGGAVLILKNNKPRYVLLPYSDVDEVESAQDETLDTMAQKLLARHRDAFLKLAE
jgi:antitoxin Phd